MVGRPSKCTPELAELICNRVAKGESIRAIGEDAQMPNASTIHRWVSDNEDFRKQYARAREAQADFYAEQIIQIADDGRNDTYALDDGSKKVAHDHIQRSKLRVEARMWKASKLAPKKYGDKLHTELTGADGGPVQLAQAVDRPPDETREQWEARKRKEAEERQQVH